MEKIVIFNANNESMEVDVVRYFSEGENKYFIFSLHELDAQGHMNIYVTKIINQNGVLVGTNIIDDVEWSNLKTNLQRIIKENRANGNAIVNDLPYNNLKNIKVADRRALKLLAASVDMLNFGYNPQSNEESKIESFEQPNVQNSIQPNNNSMNNVPNNLEIFNGNAQTVQNDVQNFNNNVNTDHQSVQKTVDNSISQNYKDLYFNEKETTTKLKEENNRLINELNTYKMMISDIKNILSRQ